MIRSTLNQQQLSKLHSSEHTNSQIIWFANKISQNIILTRLPNQVIIYYVYQSAWSMMLKQINWNGMPTQRSQLDTEYVPSGRCGRTSRCVKSTVPCTLRTVLRRRSNRTGWMVLEGVYEELKHKPCTQRSLRTCTLDWQAVRRRRRLPLLYCFVFRKVHIFVSTWPWSKIYISLSRQTCHAECMSFINEQKS